MPGQWRIDHGVEPVSGHAWHSYLLRARMIFGRVLSDVLGWDKGVGNPGSSLVRVRLFLQLSSVWSKKGKTGPCHEVEVGSEWRRAPALWLRFGTPLGNPSMCYSGIWDYAHICTPRV